MLSVCLFILLINFSNAEKSPIINNKLPLPDKPTPSDTTETSTARNQEEQEPRAFETGQSGFQFDGPSHLMYLPVIQAGDLIHFKNIPCSCPPTEHSYKFSFDANPHLRRAFQTSARQARTGKRHDPRWASLPLVKLGKKRYFFITSNKMTWMDSMQFCSLLGMEPISLLNAEETTLLASYVTASDFRHETLWINGATSIGTSGNYRWLTTGQPVVEQDIVMTLQSLQSPLKRCLVLKLGQLEAEYCNHSGFNFMCEIRDA